MAQAQRQEQSPYTIYTPGVRRDRQELIPVTTTTVTYVHPDDEQVKPTNYELQPYKPQPLPRYFAYPHATEEPQRANGFFPEATRLPSKPRTTDMDGVDKVRVLAEIPAIGQHRFMFGLNKYPAIVSIILAVWLLWGRGESCQTWQEEAVSIVSFIAGIYIILCWFYGQLNHYNNVQRAREQTIVRMIQVSGNIILAIVMLVFAILVIVDERDSDARCPTTTPSTSTSTTIQPYNNDETVVIASVLLGMSILILLFSLISLSFGAYAVTKLDKIKRRMRRAARAARDNRGAEF